MALQKCHECGKDVSSEAKSCLNCGAMVKPLEIAPKQPYKPGGCVLVIGAILLLIFLITASQTCQQNSNIRKGQELAAEYQKQLNKEKENEEAQFIANIDSNYKKLINYYKSKNIGWAKSIIDDFKKYGKMDYKDVTAIEKRVSDPAYIIEAEKKVARENELYMIKKREEMARKMENDYLSNGLDVKISLSGADKTSIRLEYVLFSRPLIHKLTNETDFFPNLREAGFKKVVLDNKYDINWSYDLTK